MTEEQFTADQLREEIEGIKRRHSSEITEKNAEIRELKATIRTKRRIEDVTHAEYTLEYFPRVVLLMLKRLDPSGRYAMVYTKSYSLINYMLVCGTGVIINNLVQAFLYSYLGGALNWMVINNLAIAVAFFWNYVMSVGPLGFFWGLSPKVKKVKKAQK